MKKLYYVLLGTICIAFTGCGNANGSATNNSVVNTTEPFSAGLVAAGANVDEQNRDESLQGNEVNMFYESSYGSYSYQPPEYEQDWVLPDKDETPQVTDENQYYEAAGQDSYSSPTQGNGNDQELSNMERSANESDQNSGADGSNSAEEVDDIRYEIEDQDSYTNYETEDRGFDCIVNVGKVSNSANAVNNIDFVVNDPYGYPLIGAEVLVMKNYFDSPTHNDVIWGVGTTDRDGSVTWADTTLGKHIFLIRDASGNAYYFKLEITDTVVEAIITIKEDSFLE